METKTKGHGMTHATQSNPHGRFCKGTVIRIEGAPVKADNGTFEINAPFPAQPSGAAYLQWTRLTKAGNRSKAASAIRGMRADKLEALIEQGICTVVSAPQAPESTVEPAEAGSVADLFGEVIHSYTRAQALADGVLVDCSKLAAEAGITFPVACTAAVWALINPERMPCGQSTSGRGWDLVWMLRCTIKAGAGGSNIAFQVIFGFEGPRGGYRQQLTNLKAVCGPGDNAEPVITVMLPSES